MGETRREFLGWNAPMLPLAARLLLDHAPDMSTSLVVLPGRRSARVLTGMLVDQAARRRVVLSPPTMLTPGELVAAILRPSTNPAPPLLRRMAWISVLRDAPLDELAPLIRLRPDAGDLDRWSSLASIVERVCDDLARELVLPAEVPDKARATGADNEDARWLALSRLQHEYEQRLERAGFSDDELHALRALRDPGTPVTPRDVTLIGVPELARGATGALRKLLAAGGRVTAMIGAPADHAHRFDDLGAVRPGAWANVVIPLADDALAFANAPRDQARRAIAFIAALPRSFAPHEITIGVPDDDVLPAIEREAQRAGLAVRRAAGKPLRQSTPAALLGDIAAYAGSRTYATLIDLLVRPEIEAHLRSTLAPPARSKQRRGTPRTEWWLAEIQDYAASTLATDLDSPIPGHQPAAPLIREVIGAIDTLLAELIAVSATRPPSRWGGAIFAVLARLHAGQRLDKASSRDLSIIDAATRLRGAIAALDDLPDDASPPLTAPQVIRLLLDVAGDAPLPAPPRPDAAELLGWLELPLDPAPVLVITGLNEGFVPGGNVADPFLPDSLRSALGMANDLARLARDTFLLRMIATSRPHLLVISGRRASDGSPLRPSRLLVACDPRSAAARVLRFADPLAEPPASIQVRSRLHPGGKGGFEPCRVLAHAPITSMRVTAFRDYLASPYAFYLRHVLRLEESSPPGTEMDALAFGVLVHNALKRFGLDAHARDLADPAPIAAFLHDALEIEARAAFGTRPLPAVMLQLAAAQRRLGAFAGHQARRRAAGWRIAHTEWPEKSVDASLVVDASPFGLRGRIDRIDVNEKTGEWTILDYKTGDDVKPPETTHLRGARWVDLQLPLYRHLVTSLGPPADPGRLRLGYASISSKLDAPAFLIANWSFQDLDNADSAASDVVRAVRAGDFGDVGSNPPDEGILSYLCGVGFPSPPAEPAP